MGAEISFQYFYGNEAEQYTFYRIPKLIITDEYFKSISSDAKILYGLMLDRMSLSAKNGWLDDKKRVFIYFSTEEIMDALNVGKNKAIKTVAELDADGGIGLIERTKQGQGKPAKIYVKNFVKPGIQKFTFQTSRSLLHKPIGVYEVNPNKNKVNDTEISDNKSHLIVSTGGRCDEMRYEDIIFRNIELNLLIERSPLDKELLEGIYNLILETVLSQSETIVIASNRYPTSFVKNKFLKLHSGHVEYVLDCFRGNTTKVKNIKKYLLAALFNAPTTISGFYQAEVNHDMSQFAMGEIRRIK